MLATIYNHETSTAYSIHGIGIGLSLFTIAIIRLLLAIPSREWDALSLFAKLSGLVLSQNPVDKFIFGAGIFGYIFCFHVILLCLLFYCISFDKRRRIENFRETEAFFGESVSFDSINASEESRIHKLKDNSSYTDTK